jgi:hypothetical protein
MNEDYYKRLAEIESGGNPNAQNPNSSAGGLFQFTDATAKQYGLDDKMDPVKSRQAVEKFTADNAKTLTSKLGREPTQGELYLAHQQGAGGALKLLSNPDRKAIEVVGVDEVLNNGGDKNMTAAAFASKWTGKFGDKPVSLMGGEGQTVMVGEPGKDKIDPVKNLPKPILLPDGGQVQLTGEETPEQITAFKQKLFEKYGNSMAVDRNSGAPANVRAIVGSVTKPEDRLATLRQYYPEAIEYGDDNFLFIDPQTGKSTLYNPKGLDIGDVASIGREVAVVGGSIVGAAGGGAVGLGGGPVAPASVPAGAIIGAGFGGMAAGDAFDMLLNTFSPRVDSRTVSERHVDKAIDFAGSAAGEGFGRALSYGGKKLLGGGTKTAQKIYNQFVSSGIRPSSAVTSKSAIIGKLEAGLAQSPGGADIMEKQALEIVDQTQTALNNIVKSIGDAKTPQGTGSTIKQAAIDAAKRFDFNQEKLYDDAFDLIGADSAVRVDALRELSLEISQELSRAPKSLKTDLNPALERINNIIADAGEDGINFTALRQIRTSIGRNLADPLSSGATASQNVAMKRIYGAMTDDMARAAESTSPEAAKTIAKADRYTRMWMNGAKETMDKIVKFDADEKAFKFALSSSRDGGTSLARLRRNFKPEEWDVVAASVLNNLGDASAGMQNAAGDAFSINTFMTNWNKLAPEAKDALFGGARYKSQRIALDNLTDLMSGIKDVKRFANTSNSAGAMMVLMGASSIGSGVVGGLASGDPMGAVQGVGVGLVGSFLAPRAAAKLITNPAFVEWLGTPITQAGKKTAIKTTADWLARLTIVGEANPEIKEEINQFIKQMQFDTAPDPLPN